MDPSVAEVRDGGVENVGRGVNTGLAGILDNTDDETYTYNLHCDVVTDTEQGASQRSHPQSPQALLRLLSSPTPKLLRSQNLQQ